MVFFYFIYLLILSFFLSPTPSLHRSSHSPLLIQFLYLFVAFVADGVADVVPEGGVELGVVTLSELGALVSVNLNR